MLRHVTGASATVLLCGVTLTLIASAGEPLAVSRFDAYLSGALSGFGLMSCVSDVMAGRLTERVNELRRALLEDRE